MKLGCVSAASAAVGRRLRVHGTVTVTLALLACDREILVSRASRLRPLSSFNASIISLYMLELL